MCGIRPVAETSGQKPAVEEGRRGNPNFRAAPAEQRERHRAQSVDSLGSSEDEDPPYSEDVLGCDISARSSLEADGTGATGGTGAENFSQRGRGVGSFIEKMSMMHVGEKVQIADTQYEIAFKGIKHVEGPNYSAEQGQLEVYNKGNFVTLLKPERRTYLVQTMGMTEAGIDPGLFRDIYVALGDPLAGNAWAIRVHFKPFVRWIWLGAIFMALGGVLAILDKRYRRKKKVKVAVNTVSATTTDNNVKISHEATS